MHECNAMQILEKKKNQENGHKGFWNEVQRPYQKDSIELSLLRASITS